MGTSDGSEIKFRCGHCKKTQRAPQRMAGRVGKCSSCDGRIQVPGEAPLAAKAVDPVAFALKGGTKEKPTACVLVVEQDALRVIDCAGMETIPDGLVPDPSAHIDAAAKVATKDSRVAFERVRSVEKDFLGGLTVTYGRSEPKTLHVSLGDEAADLALKHLGKAMKGFKASEKEVSVGTAVVLPAMLAVGVSLLGWFLHATSAALQTQGVPMRGIGALVAALIRMIGPTGFAVGTGVIVGLALLTIASRMLTPPRVPVLSRA